MNPRDWQRRGFTFCRLPKCETLSDNPLMEALAAHRQAEVPDHAAFCLDFPRSLAKQTGRDRARGAGTARSVTGWE